MKIYPDKDKAFTNPAIPSLCYIKKLHFLLSDISINSDGLFRQRDV